MLPNMRHIILLGKNLSFLFCISYCCFRTTRTNLDELVLHLNKTIREFINEGNEKVETLREDDVAPAVRIVTDYRFRIKHAVLFFRVYV